MDISSKLVKYTIVSQHTNHLVKHPWCNHHKLHNAMEQEYFIQDAPTKVVDEGTSHNLIFNIFFFKDSDQYACTVCCLLYYTSVCPLKKVIQFSLAASVCFVPAKSLKCIFWCKTLLNKQLTLKNDTKADTYGLQFTKKCKIQALKYKVRDRPFPSFLFLSQSHWHLHLPASHLSWHSLTCLLKIPTHTQRDEYMHFNRSFIISLMCSTDKNDQSGTTA